MGVFQGGGQTPEDTMGSLTENIKYRLILLQIYLVLKTKSLLT